MSLNRRDVGSSGKSPNRTYPIDTNEVMLLPEVEDARLPIVCISHQSALRFFMSTPNDARICWPVKAVSRELAPELPPRKAPSAAEAETAMAELAVGFNELHVLVSSEEGRRRSTGLIPHCTSAILEADAFYQIDSSLIEAYVTSPELTYLEIAGSSDFIATVAAGCALCSAYRYEPTAWGGVVNRNDTGEPPWTSPQRLERFLRRRMDARGASRGLAALQYVYENAWSPKESGIALVCGLPFRYGGYSLGLVHMNPKLSIFVGQDGYGHRRYRERIPDIVITATGTDGARHTTGIDYDPWSTHGSHDRIVSDTLRRNQIATVGSLSHITITTEQAMHYGLFETSIDEVRRTLRVRKGPRFASGITEEEKVLKTAKTNRQRKELWERVVKSSDLFGADVGWGTRPGSSSV